MYSAQAGGAFEDDQPAGAPLGQLLDGDDDLVDDALGDGVV